MKLVLVFRCMLRVVLVYFVECFLIIDKIQIKIKLNFQDKKLGFFFKKKCILEIKQLYENR